MLRLTGGEADASPLLWVDAIHGLQGKRSQQAKTSYELAPSDQLIGETWAVMIANEVKYNLMPVVFSGSLTLQASLIIY